MGVLSRNNVTVAGEIGPLMVFSHGFGCDQTMWRAVARRFETRAQVALFDHVGAGGSEDAAHDPIRHANLQGYAEDLIDVIEALNRGPAIFVGHSVSATIGVLSAVARPDCFRSLVLLCASPCYINRGDYRGGFSERDVEELLELMDKNTADWSALMAARVAGPSDAAAQSDWQASVCRINPVIAKTFARATFLSDHRADYARVTTPTLLIESAEDVLAPDFVGAWVAATVRGSRRRVLPTEGHAPHMTAPELTAQAVAVVLQDPFLARAA